MYSTGVSLPMIRSHTRRTDGMQFDDRTWEVGADRALV